jgi:hypothetical protein
MVAQDAGWTGRMTPASITKIRNDREARARRHLELARLLRDDPQATNVDLAKALHVDRHTITSDRLAIMTQVNQEALTETQLYREDQLTRIAEKWDAIEKSNMSDAEKHREWRGWMKLEVEIRGTAAPSKSIVGQVSGPQLDALYLEIRQELLDLGDGDKQDALLLMREFAKARKKPVVVDAMRLQPVERSLTDGNVS